MIVLSIGIWIHQFSIKIGTKPLPGNLNDHSRQVDRSGLSSVSFTFESTGVGVNRRLSGRIRRSQHAVEVAGDRQLISH